MKNKNTTNTNPNKKESYVLTVLSSIEHEMMMTMKTKMIYIHFCCKP